MSQPKTERKRTIARLEKRLRGERVTLTKGDLVRITAGLIDQPIWLVDNVVNGFLYALRTMLEDSLPGDTVEIRGFGSFRTVVRKLPTRFGLRSIESIDVEALKGRRTVKFRPGKNLMKYLDMNEQQIEEERKRRWGALREAAWGRREA